MFIIDESYFVKEYNIPNINSIDVTGGSQSFNDWINDEVANYLQGLLGAVEYDDLLSNLTDGDIDGSTEQKFIYLIEGRDYNYNGKGYKWKGLRYSNQALPKSMLVPFVFCKWLSFNMSQMTGMGEKVGSSINASSISSTERYVKAWNSFVSQNQRQSLSGTPSISYKGGVKFTDYAGNNNNGYVTAIEYLNHFSDDFTDLSLKTYSYKNSFGI